MHEFSLIADLITKIDTIAHQEHAHKVVGVRVRLGALSHISAEHFQEHFYQEAKGTISEHARLSVDVSRDELDPHAQDIILDSVEVEGADD